MYIIQSVCAVENNGIFFIISQTIWILSPFRMAVVTFAKTVRRRKTRDEPWHTDPNDLGRRWWGPSGYFSSAYTPRARFVFRLKRNGKQIIRIAVRSAETIIGSLCRFIFTTSAAVFNWFLISNTLSVRIQARLIMSFKLITRIYNL